MLSNFIKMRTLQSYANLLRDVINCGHHVRWIGSTSTDLSTIREEFQRFTGGSVKLTLNEDTGIADVCLSHPEKKNALTGTMMVQFADIVRQLEQWTSGKAIVIHTPREVFCSGGDLDMVQKIATSQQGLAMSTLMHDTLERFISLPLISVAVVQGNAMGGGAELALTTDFRLLTKAASFQFLQARLGVGTGWGGGTLLVRLLGPSNALQLLTTSKKVSAEEALNMGLASGILESDSDLLTQACDWLRPMTSCSPDVIRTMKSIVHGAASMSLAESLKNERHLFAALWGGPAHITALKRVLKHR